MFRKQELLDRIRLFNKNVTNKIMSRISGKKFGHFALISHEGRKSGKVYTIPIIAEPVNNGFIFALTYGRKVDWCSNVLGKGGCSLVWKNNVYKLNNPEFVDKEIGLGAFPLLFRSGLKIMRIEYFLKLSIIN
jgi:hypothetical protein